MKRIGVAASKIAKDNYWLYHIYVVIISSIVSLFIFLVTGVVVAFALVILAYISSELMEFDFQQRQMSILLSCMVSLTIVIVIFNILAISRNIRLPNDKK
ncbi:MAG: hypothetical protein ACI9F2_000543 [Lysobacterales bacterium]|jgi:hypothetical protein